MSEAVEKFLNELESSLVRDTFVKLTLGNYKGTENQLQRILGRLITTSKGRLLSLTYRYQTRDITKNFEIPESNSAIRAAFDQGFRSGHLFTTERDLQLELNVNKARLSETKSTFSSPPSTEHNRQKKLQIDPSAPYLAALGVTDKNGRVLDRQRDKWRQINKYIEILASLVEKSELGAASTLNIVDMGSGKGYLTFAAYDHFNNHRSVRTKITGIEAREELVDLCNQIAVENGFVDLTFKQGNIADTELDNVDILIALHACDTATDDAIYKGIKGNAKLIITAPCCHQEVRPQIKPPEVLKDVLKQGILLEHEAETITHGLRAMMMEASGYGARVFEFVGVEHTPKNNMIVGTRHEGVADKEQTWKRIQDLMEFYGIRRQRLFELLSKDEGRAAP
jgi:SAM-dependent methyltransferase